MNGKSQSTAQNTPQHLCAALGMYDWPETRDHVDLLWQLLKKPLLNTGVEISDLLTLDRDRSQMDIWQDPGLVLGQTCGWPFTRYLQQKTTLLGTPDYTAPGCREGHYVSWILVRSDDPGSSLVDFADSRVAVNDRDSQSGYNAIRLALSVMLSEAQTQERKLLHSVKSGYFASVVYTGAHRNSLLAVAEGRADLCAVDPVCLALSRQHDASVIRKLKIIGKTPETPSLPLIASKSITRGIDVPELRLSLKQVLSDLPRDLQESLHLDGLTLLDETHYQKITQLTDRAIELGIDRIASDQSEFSAP
ncbi:MAG: PhnD/SsuA/transferrin family substrate-binding protein [Granulosicoccus sp.]|nr:PhnD/SsuA/transferrin family substrate-binding protein [Granulosicoccus sp.]